MTVMKLPVSATSHGIAAAPTEVTTVRPGEPDRGIPASGSPGPAVLWVFRDYRGRWCVRMEGGVVEAEFLNRNEALTFARVAGRADGSYRLFLELNDGRVTQEFFNLGPATKRAAIR